MKILLYGINFAPELTGIGKYSGEMVEWLVQQGHQVHVVTAPPYYPQWQVQPPYSKWRFKKENWHGATVIRCPMYVPKKPTAITRLLHLADFALSSLVGLVGQLHFKPDVIITVEPTLFCTPASLLYARLTGAKSWLHIQDFELDAMFGLGMARTGRLQRLALAVERWLMRRFDRVSSISAAMLKLAENKGVAAERLRFFPNWADIGQIQPLPGDRYFRDLWQLGEKKIVLYAGNIGKKQGLELVIDAARQWQHDPDVVFVIAGDGAHCRQLQQQAEGLDNVLFKPLQPLEQLNRLLAMADIHLVIQKAGAADLVLPSKLTNILAAGGYSIITADSGTALGDFCLQQPGIARRVDAEQPAQFMVALQQELAAIASRPAINQPACDYARQHLAKAAVLQQLEQDLLALAGAHNGRR